MKRGLLLYFIRSFINCECVGDRCFGIDAGRID